MFPVWLWLLLVCFGQNRLAAAPPPGYYDSAQGKQGQELRAALHETINDHTILPYSSGSTVDARDALEFLDQDPLNSSNVILIYERRSEPSTNFDTVWNREHLWPNSYGIDSVVPEFSDVFNLRPADASVNTSRGNKYFDISDPGDPYYHNPGHPEAPLTTTDEDSWEPPVVVRGDIARALFYMDVRYEGDRPDEVDLVLTDGVAMINSATNFMGRLSTLLLWHQQDPVDDAELLRNDRVFEIYQGNRNPFVDHPEWVALVFTTNQSTPVITSQPHSLTVAAGGNATFSVTASGAPPLAYQWRLNQTNIPGATASSHALTNVQGFDAGDYSVVVSNALGSVASSNATLTVSFLPIVTGQPQDQTVFAGQTASFSVTASGPPPLSYQWQRNGTNITGATASSFSRTNAELSDAGSYSVMVSNFAGSVASSNATLAIVTAPLATIARWNFNSDPPDANTATGTTLPSAGSGTASAVGAVSQTFFSGSTNDPASSGTDNSGWSTASYPAQGTANKTAGVQFNVSTVGKENIVIAWNQRVSATASKYVRLQYSTNGIHFIDFPSSMAMSTITNFESRTCVLAGFAGVGHNPSFAFRIVTEWEATAAGTANSNYVTTAGSGYGTSGTIRFDMMTVSGTEIAPPSITSQPESQVLASGHTANFSVTAAGTPPLTYQWRFNGTAIDGATASGYTRTNVQFADAGQYSVAVSNAGGVTISSNAVLTVVDPPTALFALWDFNSVIPDAAVTTGSTLPSVGSGAASLVGTATATFATGSPEDPAAAGNDNSAWNTAGYPTQGTGNKTAGVRFDVSTVGRENVVITWNQRVSATASKYARLQYSTNGIDFIDFPTANSLTAVTVFEAQTNSLAGFAGVADNPLFAFRIVTEWESTAIGTTNAFYVTAGGSSYGTSGTLRFDMLRVIGRELLRPPTIVFQPQSRNAVAGTAATFSVAASGTAPLTYQWQFGGANLPAATNATLLLTNLTAGQAGDYSVTVGNFAGSTNSNMAVLSVYDSAAPALSSVFYANNSFQLNVAGVPGLDYAIQASTNLADWISLQTNASPFTFVDENAGLFPHRFYRAIYVP